MATVETLESIDIDLADYPKPQTVYTGYVSPPAWSEKTALHLNCSAMSGTAEAVDFALSYVDPLDNTVWTAFPGSGITQITAAGAVVVMLDNIAADDDVAPVYTLHCPAGMKVGYTLTLANPTQVQEVQTLDLGDIGAGDTYYLTYDSTECTDPITYAATSTSDIQAAMDEILADDAACVVTRTDANTYVLTFAAGFNPTGQVSVTNVTGFTPKADGGYTDGVIITTPFTAGDEKYTITLSAVYAK